METGGAQRHPADARTAPGLRVRHTTAQSAGDAATKPSMCCLRGGTPLSPSQRHARGPRAAPCAVRQRQADRIAAPPPRGWMNSRDLKPAALGANVNGDDVVSTDGRAGGKGARG